MIQKTNVIQFPFKDVSILRDKPRGMAVMTGFIAAKDGLAIVEVLEIMRSEMSGRSFTSLNIDTQVREGYQLWSSNPNLTVAEVFSE